MALKFQIADDVLAEFLRKWFAARAGTPALQFCLFRNQFPGALPTDPAAYAEATFPGYARVTAPWATWSPVVVAGHVARSNYTTPLVYTAAVGTFPPQQVWGYYVLAGGGVYQWSQQFATPTLFEPGTQRQLLPSLRNVLVGTG